MIKAISYHLPYTNQEEKDFFTDLSRILKELPNSHTAKEHIILEPLMPKGALPVTSFVPVDTPYPQVVLDTQEIIDLEVGNLYIRSTRVKDEIRVINHRETIQKTKKKDAIGEYMEVTSNNQKFHLLTLGELYKRLKNHIVRIDHTGINIPTKIINQKQWDTFIQQVASVSNLYRYPTGEPWLFILPATKQECEQNITEFPLDREPKCEIVYDEYSDMPTIQIDIASNLTRSEVEKILPQPYGISFPDLANYFRTVYINHPWQNLAIRFDIRFKNDAPGGDWDTGKWLVTDGKRIRLK